MNYFDTSALIKRFIVEPGSDVVKALIGRDALIATSKVAYAELYAGITRKKRDGHLSASDYRTVCRQFEADWPAYVRVELQDAVLVRARDLIKRHSLRGFDALHLASALHLRHSAQLDMAFIAADQALLHAARNERFRVIDPAATDVRSLRSG